jgi:hypothetical protein
MGRYIENLDLPLYGLMVGNYGTNMANYIVKMVPQLMMVIGNGGLMALGCHNKNLKKGK